MKLSNGSGLAPLWAFCATLIIAANIRPLMLVWAPMWAIIAFRYMAKPRNRGADLMTGEGSSE